MSADLRADTADLHYHVDILANWNAEGTPPDITLEVEVNVTVFDLSHNFVSECGDSQNIDPDALEVADDLRSAFLVAGFETECDWGVVLNSS